MMISKAFAFMRRDFQTQTSYRLDFILQLFGMVASVSIFYFISQILDVAVSPFLEQYETDYFHFALMGIAFYPFIGISSNSLSEAVHEYQHTGTLEIIFLSPTPFFPLLVMSTLWKYCWATVQTLFYLLIATLIFQADLNWLYILSAFGVVLLTVFANLGIGLINAGFVIATKRPSPLARMTQVITNLFSGVYYPVAILPDWLQFVSYLLPATYAFEALRAVMLNGQSLWAVRGQLLPLLLFTFVLLPIGLIALQYAIRWAKVDGSLSQY